MKRRTICGLIVLLFLNVRVFVTDVQAYYDPTIQRWINRDPLNELGFETIRNTGPPEIVPFLGPNEFWEGPNLYAFVNNTPLSNIDYQGLFLGFSYGNWCGYSTSGQGGNPIDDLDTLCMIHDYCLATWSNACAYWKPCNLWFCSSVAGVDCKKSPNPSACQSAQKKIVLLCVLLSPTYTYP